MLVTPSINSTESLLSGSHYLLAVRRLRVPGLG